MKNIGIYGLYNKKKNKWYIGQSIDIDRRWMQHINAAKDVNHPGYHNPLYTDLRNHFEDFEFIILEHTTREQLNSKELEWMKRKNSLQNGYNIKAENGQFLILENIISNEKKKFSTFNQLEQFLRVNNITTSRNLIPFFKRAIKNKNIIYQKYKLYYWKGE